MAGINTRVRKAVESLYFDSCTVYEYCQVINDNKSTGFKEKAVIQDCPCKLSYETDANTSQSETADYKKQVIKLFMAPELIIKAGSRIDVKHLDRVLMFKCSGEPLIYPSHQEVMLTVYESKA